jgi:hypothetical protein
MEDTATISKVRVRFPGVKTTLNKLAVRLELAWHVLRELDSIKSMAEAVERRERREIRKMKGEHKTEDRMMAVIIVVSMPSSVGEGGPGFPIRS